MTEKQAKERIEKLRKEINRHRYLYHVQDRQEISDAALDSLKHELDGLERRFPSLITPDSPTQRVGGKPLDAFKKVKHETPMISLSDVFSKEEVREWEARNKKILRAEYVYYAEYKIDGLALSLIYNDGTLVRASTRGDGQTGEDVTMNAKTIDAIPLTLPDYQGKYPRAPKRIEVRGEVYLPKKHFDQLNARQKKEGLPLFANPRNAAAGTVRQLDPKITASRKLSFLGYDVVTDIGVATHHEEHAFLEYIGIPSGMKNNRLCSTLEEIEAYHAQTLKQRERLPYWVDGIVVSIDDSRIYERLGVVGKAPRGAVAYKYPAEQATTIVRDIQVQVGRTGVLTPVAHMDPVSLAGTTVTRATLHNMDEIKRLGVRIGDTVIVQKAGDIIPDIVQVLPNLRTGKEKEFVMPAWFGSPDNAVFRKKGEVNYYVKNLDAFDIVKERIVHFVSKGAFDIDGLGPQIVEQLLQEGLVKDPADLFTLTQGDIEPLPGFAKKSAENLVQAIAKARRVPFHRFLYGLGIRHVGEQTAKQLARKFGSLQKLQGATLESLMSVDDIGSIVARSIYDYFSSREGKKLVHKLHAVGVVPLQEQGIQKKAGPLSGKRVVVTGTLKNLSREEAKRAIEDAGGSWVSSVSAKTDYVLVGADPGSKAEKARTLGVRIIDEEEFDRLRR